MLGVTAATYVSFGLTLKLFQVYEVYSLDMQV